ncbi:MAG TPA: DNA polymerase III subunit beta [Solirubrobacteraceae bacterium]|nr:DNA polymerase III subunit beta [Solirubrobacteraceae bacterium]
MKLSISTADLLAQLQTTSRVAASRTAVQALSGVMLTAHSDSRSELLATDMEVGLRVPLTAEVSRPGSVVLPARLLLDVVRSLPAQHLTIELRAAEQDVELISGSATFHLRTLRAEDFPSLPVPAPETRVSLPAEAFVQTVARVARSASRDETRPVLTGILMSASGQQLRMVATDSYRLSVKETALETPLEGSLEANVPARALQELVRIAQQASPESLSVSVGQNQAIFELGDVVLSSRLIDGQFPNYRQLLPESVEHELRLASAEVADVVRRVSLLAQKNAPLRLSFSEGSLTVSAQTPDVGEASEAIPVSFHGEPFEIGFNPDFLRDGLESIETDELVLKLISPLRPGLIESPDTGDFVYLIMPIRLNV